MVLTSLFLSLSLLSLSRDLDLFAALLGFSLSSFSSLFSLRPAPGEFACRGEREEEGIEVVDAEV